jgi:hypothetical protein
MSLVFNELNRICKENSKIIFIVGRESSVRKTNFRNGEIVSEIACACCNMKLINRQERVFVNRYGTNIYEDILHFKSAKKTNKNISVVKDIAYKVLKSVSSQVPEECKDDLIDAMDKIDEIQTSPILKIKELVRR